MHSEVIKIQTPKKYLLQGLWFGPSKPEKVIIAIHGLTSNLFSDTKYLPLVNDKTAVFLFNNRGHDFVSKLKKLNPDNTKGYDSKLGGSAHEVFEDCADDIEGVVQIAEKKGVKSIYLVGHSTGCQKSMYYTAQLQDQKRVAGVVLIAPISDYSYTVGAVDKDVYNNALMKAKEYVKNGELHKLLPVDIWPEELIDAQRFMSLYTPDSAEEIFSYVQKDKTPDVYSSVKVSVLVMLAGADEYDVLGAEKLTQWFKKHSGSTNYSEVILPSVPHNLNGHEDDVCKKIQSWLESISK